jgi:Phage tail tube protein
VTTTIGAGIGGQIGFAKATTYGTYAAPTNFYEVGKAAVTKTKKTVQSSGIAAGRLVDLTARRAVTSQAGTVPLELEVMQSGHFGLLLQQAFGTTAAPVQQASSTAYLQTHTPLTLAGIHSTVQAGIPDTTGLLHQYNFNGCKCIDVTFACAVDTFLTSQWNFDARQVEETDALAAPSYPVVSPFDFSQSAVSWGTFGSEASIDGVKKIDIKLERKQNTSRYYQGNAGLKDEPITNDPLTITGTIEADFINKAYFYDVFSSDAPQSLIWTFTGPVIASTYHYFFQIALPSVRIDSPGPGLDSKDIVSSSFAFTALYDGANPAITLTYQSTDTTL